MSSSYRFRTTPFLRRALLAAIVSGLSGAAAIAQPVTDQLAAQARAQAVAGWHDNLTAQGAPSTGCYRASFPSNTWTAEQCAPPPKLMSAAILTAATRAAVEAHKGRVTPQAATSGTLTTGNGNDYAAKTASLTKTAVGTFPTVTGVNSGGSQNYSLQINTDIGSNPTTCSQFGYSSCQTWEQFIYATDDGNGPVAFIQNWFFAGSDAEYNSQGCPSGWNAYPDQDACYRNSNAVSVSYVPLANLASIRLTGAANQSGKDSVTFTINGVAHTVSESATTLNIGKIWKQSEFNIFGNDSSQPLVSFNRGSKLSVRVGVTDGSTNAPTCLSGAGTTFEQNNLALGSCTASGGSSPAIQFSESN